MTFADTSFLVALANANDRFHEVALALLAERPRATLAITNHVRAETWTTVQARAGHHRAVQLLDRLEASPRFALSHLDAALEREALIWLRSHDERKYSFVDATSFAFMRTNGITEALAFDGDFAAAGFVELRP